MVSRTGSRLAFAFLAYLIGVTLLVTLVPFDFRRWPDMEVLLGGQVPDFIANVAMFVPLGFLYRLSRPSHRDRFGLQALLVAALFSTGIELAQLFLPSRISAPLDVVANGIGGWFGALIHDRITARIRVTPALVGNLALELPLMGLLYLMVPLLWLSGLTAADDVQRLLLSLVLGLIGSMVLGAVYRHRFGPTGAIGRIRYGILASGWFLAGALPGLALQPLWVAIASLAVGLNTILWSMERLPHTGPERRFERETLRRVAPFFALYLLFLAGWPPWSEWTPFHGSFDTIRLWGHGDTFAIMRVLEQLASFTVLGYLVAESRGRLELAYGRTLPLLVGAGFVSAVMVEVVAGLHPGPGASPVRALVAVAITCYGGGIYHLQRSHIRWLLRHESSIPMIPLGDSPGIEPARLPTNSLVREERRSRV
ncbi:MAG TPA: VanZ family protein [Gemmatimonadales bacterium]|nr:VanZ family protein [Gemmatimonadales bacterium]